VVISVPGGPGLHQEFRWYPHWQYLANAGIDVITFNYRGQAGFGAAFLRAYLDSTGAPRADGDSLQVQDVLAVRDYVHRELGIAPTDIALLGHSHGAHLVASAVATEPHGGPVVLASITSTLWRPPAPPRVVCALAYHGEKDELITAETARREIATRLGAGAIAEPCGHFRVLSGERHWYARLDSWAEVYASVATMLSR
jgi:dipeptidyl aminopeptidase/acylaminoacyl peptidase